MLSPMNRQIRREQAKQDKRADKDRQRRRAARRARITNTRQRRSSSSKAPAGRGGGAQRSSSQGKRTPGRFSGVLMIATVFFIVLQAAVPVKNATTLNSVTGAGFFLLFGYFSVLYLERRGAGKGLLMTLVSGAVLVIGVSAARMFQPALGMDWLMMGLAYPGVVAGAFLGRLVFYNSPA